MRFSVLLLVILFSYCGNMSRLFGQRLISGQIVNSKTQVPIEYAHIFLLNQQDRGVMSNQLGRFRISLEEDNLQDTLVISQIGYQTRYLFINQVQDSVLVQLEENVYELDQVTIWSEEALKSLFKKAIDKIPENFGARRYSMQGYYQEYFISDSVYSEIIEAFVNIEDRNYKSPETKSVIRVEALRKSDDLRNLPPRFQDNDINLVYQLYELMNNVRARRFHLMAVNPQNLFKYFSFYSLGEYTEQGDTLMKIGLKHNGASKKFREMPFTHGEVIIRKSDLGILSVKRGVSSDGSYQEATYQKINGKYYPLKLSTLLSFKYDQRSRTYLRSRQLHIYNLLPKDHKKKGQRLERKKNLRLISLPYNEAFWTNNEMLIPVPAPEVLKMDIGKMTPLEEQFKANAKN